MIMIYYYYTIILLSFSKSTANSCLSLDAFMNPGEAKLFSIPKGSKVKADIEYHNAGKHYIHVVNNPIYGNDPARPDNSMIDFDIFE